MNRDLSIDVTNQQQKCPVRQDRFCAVTVRPAAAAVSAVTQERLRTCPRRRDGLKLRFQATLALQASDPALNAPTTQRMYSQAVENTWNLLVSAECAHRSEADLHAGVESFTFTKETGACKMP